jgi:hypothetical protein
MVANNRLDNTGDSGTEDDDTEIRRLVRKLQKTLLRKANACADQGIIGEAIALSEGARSAGEIICQMNDFVEIDPDCGEFDEEGN